MKNKDPVRSEGNKLSYIIATFFGVGYTPVAPGTAGTLATIPLYLLFAFFLSPLYYAIISIALFFIGIFTAEKVSNQERGDDPKIVVIDEVVGYLVAMFLLPLSFTNIVLGFLSFRAFDVIKPPPARQFDRMSGGFGIMMDDVMSGLYANLFLRVLFYLLR
ncbi:MAG: phosphatidylglycerophosphatase A [Acidobacteria bacterium]|nr:phosphatidylglycerophosphatase A [Acidobacteriota bacterium]